MSEVLLPWSKEVGITMHQVQAVGIRWVGKIFPAKLLWKLRYDSVCMGQVLKWKRMIFSVSKASQGVSSTWHAAAVVCIHCCPMVQELKEKNALCIPKCCQQHLPPCPSSSVVLSLLMQYALKTSPQHQRHHQQSWNIPYSHKNGMTRALSFFSSWITEQDWMHTFTTQHCDTRIMPHEWRSAMLGHKESDPSPWQHQPVPLLCYPYANHHTCTKELPILQTTAKALRSKTLLTWWQSESWGAPVMCKQCAQISSPHKSNRHCTAVRNISSSLAIMWRNDRFVHPILLCWTSTQQAVNMSFLNTSLNTTYWTFFIYLYCQCHTWKYKSIYCPVIFDSNHTYLQDHNCPHL